MRLNHFKRCPAVRVLFSIAGRGLEAREPGTEGGGQGGGRVAEGRELGGMETPG